MLGKTFQPEEAEGRIYKKWEEDGAFKASGNAASDPYCIVIPPPNVTGSLHIGHALNNTLQDILVRFERMRGKDVLWKCGTDHAGISTQSMVKKHLDFEGIDWESQGREKTVEKIIESEADILLRQRELASGYNYWLNFGVSYSFGSIYNNIVNPRFGN